MTPISGTSPFQPAVKAPLVRPGVDRVRFSMATEVHPGGTGNITLEALHQDDAFKAKAQEVVLALVGHKDWQRGHSDEGSYLDWGRAEKAIQRLNQIQQPLYNPSSVNNYDM